MAWSQNPASPRWATSTPRSAELENQRPAGHRAGSRLVPWQLEIHVLSRIRPPQEPAISHCQCDSGNLESKIPVWPPSMLHDFSSFPLSRSRVARL
eukprot:1735264-Rhodomonas_salina.1